MCSYGWTSGFDFGALLHPAFACFCTSAYKRFTGGFWHHHPYEPALAWNRGTNCGQSHTLRFGDSPAIFAWHCYSPVGYERYQWSFNPFCSNCRFPVRRPHKAFTWTVWRNRGLRVPNYTKRERALKRTHSHVDGLFTRCPTAPSICILLETQGILEDNTVILIARWSSSEPTWTV